MAMETVAGNRLEDFADDLALRLSSGRGVFDKETVVVPSKGTARWLSMRIAGRIGISSNIEFILPKDFIMRRLGGMSDADFLACSKELMRWRIFGSLPGLLDDPAFKDPARYARSSGGEASELRLWELSGKLAGCFDQYLTLRYEMLLEWEDGVQRDPRLEKARRSPHWDWQRRLWLESVASMSGPDGKPLKSHPRRLHDMLSGKFPGLAKPLRRLFLFGFSTMPPLYLRIFARLGERLDCLLFHYLNPCRGYWGDISSAKERVRRFEEAEGGFLDEGNELLASLGKPGRDFFAELAECFSDFGQEELFAEPPEDGRMLSTLQRGVLDLSCASELPAPLPLEDGDDSVRIHSCHNRMRELEVLHDEILSMLGKGGPSGRMRPSDVIVMAPDIAAYAPYIEAVFGSRRYGPAGLDYSVADQSVGSEHPEVAAFLAVLKLATGRFTLPEVLAPLDCEAIRRKFSFDSASLSWLRSKLAEAGAAWGVDAAHRASFLGGPGEGSALFEENSWRFALDRLALGHAMGEGGGPDSLYENAGRVISPLGLADGDSAAAFARFSDYFFKLEALAKELQGKRPLDEWRATLSQAVDSLFDSGSEFAEGVVCARRGVNQLFLSASGAWGPSFKISASLLMRAFEELVDSEGAGSGFLRGGVTFCRMQPLRNIPAKAVCLLGLNDREFPRAARDSGFDLLKAAPRRCDRSPRDDDRQLFLEAMLSARERFRLLYVGQSDKDNAMIPPSALVDEFIDHLKALFGEGVLETLRVQHPLHPFSPKYFSESARRAWRDASPLKGSWSFDIGSFSAANLAASKVLLAGASPGEGPWARKLSSPLPMPPPDDAPEGSLEVSFEELCRFFKSPARSFLSKRLGLFVRSGDEPEPSGDEPFALDPLGAYNLKAGVLSSLGHPRAAAFFKASGSLPPGVAGEMLYQGAKAKMESFQAALSGSLKEPLPPGLRKLELELDPSEFPSGPLKELYFPALSVQGPVKVSASFERLYREGLAFFRPASRKPKDDIAAWLGHLILNACGGVEGVRDTVLACEGSGRPQLIAFHPLEAAEARRLLALAVSLYFEGLCHPLPLFQKSSKAYAEALLKQAPGLSSERLALELWPDDALLADVSEGWDDDAFDFGDGSDEAAAFCFGGRPPAQLSGDGLFSGRLALCAGEGAKLKLLSEEPFLASYGSSLALEDQFHAYSLLAFHPPLAHIQASKPQAKAGKGRR